jgi:hypothetical protein
MSKAKQAPITLLVVGLQGKQEGRQERFHALLVDRERGLPVSVATLTAASAKTATCERC